MQKIQNRGQILKKNFIDSNPTENVEVTETVEFEVKLQVRELTYAEVVDAVYALGEGEALEGTYRIYGVITSIDTEYSEQYGNITVTIQIGDLADMPIVCYRLKGIVAFCINLITSRNFPNIRIETNNGRIFCSYRIFNQFINKWSR